MTTKTCKRCEGNSYRKTLYGFVGRKVFSMVALVGVLVVILAVYFTWSSVTLGIILFIIGVTGVCSRQKQCVTCSTPGWKKNFLRTWFAVKNTTLVALLCAIAILGFSNHSPQLLPIDRLFPFIFPTIMAQWHEENGRREKMVSWCEQALKQPVWTGSWSFRYKWGDIGGYSLVDCYKRFLADGYTFSDTGSLGQIEEVLYGKSGWKRGGAVIAYSARFPVQNVIQTIPDFLDDPSPLVRFQAASSLAEVYFIRQPGNKKEFVAELENGVADQSPLVRANAIYRLGDICSRNSFNLIAKKVVDDSFSVRAAALTTLAQLGTSDQAEPYQLQGLQDRNSMVREKALEGLEKIRSPALVQKIIEFCFQVELDSKSNKQTVERLIRLLGEIGSDEAIVFLTRVIHGDTEFGNNAAMQKAAFQALQKNGGFARAAAPIIEKQLHDNTKDWQDSETRRAAVFALAATGSGEATPDLVELLTDKNRNVRLDAIKALVKQKDKNVIPEIRRLLDDGNKFIRRAAVNALVDLNDSNLSFLSSLANDPESVVRETVAKRLGEKGTAESIPELVVMMQKGNTAAEEAIVKVATRHGILYLVQLLNNPQSELRPQAAQLLGQVGSSDAIPHLVQMVKNTPPSAENADLVTEAAIALGKLGSPEAIPHLIQTIQGSSLNHVHKNRSLFSLARVDFSQAKPFIEEWLKDPENHYIAESVLLRYGNPEMVENHLKDALQTAGFPFVRTTPSISNTIFADLSLAFIVANSRPLFNSLTENKSCNYSLNLLACIAFGSNEQGYGTDLRFLSLLFNWDGQDDLFDPKSLSADLEKLKAETLLPAELPPLFSVTVAWFLKEKGYFVEAGPWVAKALVDAEGKENVALQALLYWMRAEMNHQQGRSREALQDIEHIERIVLPSLAYYERGISKLPFFSYTSLQKGVVLGALSREKEAIESFNQAERYLSWEKELSNDMAKRMKKKILASRTQAYEQAEKSDTDQGITHSKPAEEEHL